MQELGDVDFAMVLSDVSSFRSSKAKRFLRSMWLFGPSQVRDVEVAIEQLRSALEREGFHTTRARDHGEVGSGREILLLICGTDARLRREHYREQLEAWVQARTGVSGAGGEFEPQEVDEPRQYFSSARRIALLQPPLDHLLPQLEKSVLRGGDLLALQRCYPLHDRRFATQLLVHMTRHAFLQAQMLHQLRNEYGEKVAFYSGSIRYMRNVRYIRGVRHIYVTHVAHVAHVAYVACVACVAYSATASVTAVPHVTGRLLFWVPHLPPAMAADARTPRRAAVGRRPPDTGKERAARLYHASLRALHLALGSRDARGVAAAAERAGGSVGRRASA